jgi:UPF0755 protein
MRRGAVAALVLALALALWVAWAWSRLAQEHAGWSGPDVTVEIEPGLDAGAVLRRLTEAGVLRDARLARAWLAWRGTAGRLHAGEYRFDRPSSALDVLRRLERGDVVLHAVTLPEGLTQRQIAVRFAEAGLGSMETLLEAFGDPSAIRDLDPEAEDLEGYLFPDTYQFPRSASAEEIARALVARFREAVGEDWVERARRSELGVRGAVTLASMIERETAVPAERGRISRVFHNRLARGMRLECDPTVLYALERAGRPVERLTYADLRHASPWNTYVIGGLPAGPIANPGRASLEAALRPDDGNELYFVAAPGGGHRFSDDLVGHLRAVGEWRRYIASSR